jgi:hypothetical protein
MAVFSEGFGESQAKAHELAGQANDRGIPLYPVVLDYDQYSRHSPVSTTNGAIGGAQVQRPKDQPGGARFFNASTPAMDRFAAVGAATGGESFSPSHLDTDSVRRILETIRNEGISRYVAGFAPAASGAPRAHKLEVRPKVKSKDKIINGRRQASY